MDNQATAKDSFRVFESEGSDRQEWLSLFDSWQGKEVFAHPDYLALYQKPGETPICLLYSSPQGRVIHPLILRDLRASDFWGVGGGMLYDAIAPPYGYGGPFVDGNGARSVLLKSFFKEYEQWARANHVISEYNTLSPKEELEVPYPGEVVLRAPTVVRNLGESDEAIWRDYKGSVRTDIRAAQRAGVVVEIDTTGERVSDFLEIYAETMARRQASFSYHLTIEFLEQLNSTLGGYYVYFHALFGGRVVSSELVLLSADSTFFFRGGTRFDALPLRPNHLLKHHLILWSRGQGKKYYLLGGGNSAEDSLYRYKLSFAPQGARDLKVSKWIIDPSPYGEAIEARQAYERANGVQWTPSQGYFPQYRSPTQELHQSEN